MKISIINGPNLNMLGVREPDIYGDLTLSNIEENCQKIAQEFTIDMDFLQSNHEGELIELIHQAYHDNVSAIIINGAALTHTSIALLDALKATNLPIFEVHISNIHAREDFRQHSYISAIAEAVICGLGDEGYYAAMHAIIKKYK